MAKRYSCGVEIAFSGGSISLGIDELEVAALREPWLRFPVVCPRCRREELSALPVAGVAAALLNGSAIPLHVSCHDIYWHASLTEIEPLREYLIIIGIGIERVAEANHPSLEPVHSRRQNLAPNADAQSHYEYCAADPYAKSITEYEKPVKSIGSSNCLEHPYSPLPSSAGMNVSAWD